MKQKGFGVGTEMLGAMVLVAFLWEDNSQKQLGQGRVCFASQFEDIAYDGREVIGADP